MRTGRRETLGELIETYGISERNLLNSLVEAMSNDQFFDLIEFVARMEDWTEILNRVANIED